MKIYKNRQEAGQILAESLRQYASTKDMLVLALPRGGVPVAAEIAKGLSAPLDVFIVRKIGVPGHQELAMGALASSDHIVFNDEIIQELKLTQADIQPVIEYEQQELIRRESAYRKNKPPLNIKNKIIILVDDGIATGATMRVAIEAILAMQPKQLIIAVPVAAKSTINEIKGLVDTIVCPLQPTHLQAVGAWYDDFSQTTDDEVFFLLNSTTI